MNFEEWEARYQPLANHLDVNAAMNGIMFETYGAEAQFVIDTLASKPHCVWTVVEHDEEIPRDEEHEPAYYPWLIMPGWHLVNRLGYLITKVAFEASPEQINFTVEY